MYTLLHDISTMKDLPLNKNGSLAQVKSASFFVLDPTTDKVSRSATIKTVS